MTKEEILEFYNALDEGQQNRITRKARAWLASRQVPVSRQALHVWRHRDESGSPLRTLYQMAYIDAIGQIKQNQNSMTTKQIIEAIEAKIEEGRIERLELIKHPPNEKQDRQHIDNRIDWLYQQEDDLLAACRAIRKYLKP